MKQRFVVNTPRRIAKVLSALLTTLAVFRASTGAKTAGCLPVQSRGGPEDLLLLDDAFRKRWLVTATSETGFLSRRQAGVELIPLDADGAPMAESTIRHPLPAEEFKPLGLSAFQRGDSGEYDLYLLNNRRGPRLERFLLNLPAGTLRCPRPEGGCGDRRALSEPIAVAGSTKRIRSANAVEVLSDGRAIVSTPSMVQLWPSRHEYV
jgi:hypothetical protein